MVVGLEADRLTGGERILFRDFPPAGVIIFARNVIGFDQLRRLTAEVVEIIESASGLPPLVMADHEGGRSSFLAAAIGVPPSQMALARSGDLSLLRGAFRETAARMKACGLNMTLGPVADINSEYLNPVIGTRAFGESLEAVATGVPAALEALSAEGLLTCIKHFPGHGCSIGDSHHLLPVIPKTMDQLREKDLVPFAEGIAAGADTVMTAHIAPLERGIPASLDPVMVNDILRGELGFDGVVITDGLEMAGMLTGSGLMGAARGVPGDLFERGPAGGASPDSDLSASAEAGAALLKPAAVSRTALEAGNDLLLFSRPAAAVYEELETVLALLEGDHDFWTGGFDSISDRSRERIEALRIRAGGSSSGWRPGEEPFCEGIYYEASARAVEIVSDPSGMLPIDPREVPAPVFCGELSDFSYYSVRRFVLRLCENLGYPVDGAASASPGKGLDSLFGPGRLHSLIKSAVPGSQEIIEIMGWSAAAGGQPPGILVMLGRRPLDPGGLAALTSEHKVVVVAERPWDARFLPQEKTVLMSRGTYDASADALARLIAEKGPSDG